jgi:hypothetical protein
MVFADSTVGLEQIIIQRVNYRFDSTSHTKQMIV